MKLKRIKSIALFMVAVLLLTIPLAAMAALDAENRNSGERFRSDEGWRMDARYWWEVPPLTPYQRQQVKEIMTLVLDRYFGIDVSAMSPEEFEGVAKSLGPEKEWEALRLFGYYAQKRGFEVPAGIFDAPPGFDEPPGIPPRLETSPEEYTPKRLYWWEVMGYAEEEIEKEVIRIAEESGMSPDEIRARLNELFPGVDLREMTFEEYAYFLNSLPPPLIKPACLEEAKQCPNTIAVFGKMPPLPTQEALREFAEKLRVVAEEVIEPTSSPVRDLVECTILFTVTYEGVIRINVCGSHVAQADKIYEIISQRAKSLFGIEDVPVVISGGWRVKTPELPLHVEVVSDREPLASSWPPPPPYGDFYRPIVGGIAKTALCQHARWSAGSTIGFAVVERR
ncbi:hypothetical protein M1M92_05375 [Peptococcaceae bacterium]|nr:hypothetical protein [Peptococcaceae bacterium]